MDLELVVLGATLELEGPGSMLVSLSATWILPYERPKPKSTFHKLGQPETARRLFISPSGAPFGTPALGNDKSGRRTNCDLTRERTYLELLRNLLGQDLDIPVRSIHADPLPIADQPGGLLHTHDSRQAVLPRDHRAMGHQAPHLRDQARDRDEQGRPAGVRVGRDQDVARFEISLRNVMNDAGPPLDDPGGNRQADQRTGRHVVAPVRPGDDLAIRREYPGRRQRSIRPERLFALGDELIIHVVGAHDIVELLEREVEDVLLLTKHIGLHEAPGLFQHGLLVNEVAAHHAVLWILPVPDEGPNAIDLPLGLFGFLFSVRQSSQSLQQFLFLRPRFLPPVFEALRAGARLEVLDVAEDHGHERGGAFAPTRPRDVDLADAAHTVLVEKGPDGVPRFLPAGKLGQLIQEALVLDVLQKSHHFRMLSLIHI